MGRFCVKVVGSKEFMAGDFKNWDWVRGLGFNRASVFGINPSCYAGEISTATPSDKVSIVISSESLNDIIVNKLMRKMKCGSLTWVFAVP